MFYKSKIIVLVGPTASGKSEFAVRLAKKFNGEIISADSRQIYRGMNLGTGKVAGKWESTISPGHPERFKKADGYVKKETVDGWRTYANRQQFKYKKIVQQ